MNRKRSRHNRHPRRAAALVWSALAVAALLGMVASAVDLGHVFLVRTQLQAAADSAAMAAGANTHGTLAGALAAARHHAGAHSAGGGPVRLRACDVQLGRWDSRNRTFTPSPGSGNAARVTARCDAAASGQAPPFFARWVGGSSLAMSATAVATANPRDIVFVVDLSGSMNDDTEPCWATGQTNRTFASAAGRAVGNELVQQIYDDFGFGPYPGPVEHLGEPFGVAPGEYAYAELTSDTGPLAHHAIPDEHRIQPGDGETARKRKAYSAIIDCQIARIMPAALPSAQSATSYEYWAKYLDYIVDRVKIKPVPGAIQRRTSPGNRGWLPPDQDGHRICRFNNPNNSPSAGAEGDAPSGFHNQVGYVTYVQFMMDHGRDLKPVGDQYVPLSQQSPYCPWHSEETGGGEFRFPAREQPMHAVRRALIAALEALKVQNAQITDPAQADWVAIVTYDTPSGGGPAVEQPLTADYDAAMRACAGLQAAGDRDAQAATDAGLQAARLHIASQARGGQGRQAADKVVVLVASGAPGLCSTDPERIEAFIRSNPDDNYYGNRAYWLDAPLVQAAQMREDNWRVFPVGVGPRTDYDFLDRLARMAGTAAAGHSPRGTDDPVRYEKRLVDIFQAIIDRPQIRLVQ